MGPVSLSQCVWSGAGGNDNWSNPANWVNGLVPPGRHPVVVDGEAGAAAQVLLEFDLELRSRSLTVAAGDTLTIGSGAIGKKVTLSVTGPDGLLTNGGTVAVSNYSILRRDPPATVSNAGGTVRRACHGAVDLGGFTGVVIVHDPCFWDGGGETNNWSEAAN